MSEYDVHTRKCVPEPGETIDDDIELDLLINETLSMALYGCECQKQCPWTFEIKTFSGDTVDFVLPGSMSEDDVMFWLKPAIDLYKLAQVNTKVVN